MTLLHLAVILSGLLAVASTLDFQFSGEDLTDFVSRPEIKAPRFNVTIYDAANISPGYWFVAPYAMIYQQHHRWRYYEPCQTGPAIYDMNGELVWSGACTVRNQNTCDFRAWQFNDTLYLSGILTAYQDVGDSEGHGVLMDQSFETVSNIHIGPDMHNINMHELNFLEDGTKAIYIVHEPIELRNSDLRVNGTNKILDIGFREVNVATREVLFEWWAYRSNQVAVEECMLSDGLPVGNETIPFDWFHGNSVDKNQDGDYLVSSRYTDTIFKVSGKDGSILWRLGGRHSSFSQNFNFSRQHDARWRPSVDGKETISFLNNGADEFGRTATTSSAVVVDLDMVNMTATLIKSVLRPDGGLTRLRGNHQILDNGNSFVCWSQNSYITEHDAAGRVLFEAQWSTHRYITYRAYKANFTSIPIEPPTAKAIRFGASLANPVTVVYASWNGATEVTFWRFRTPDASLIGEAERTGFETTFQTSGDFGPSILVEAVNGNGDVLGSTIATITEPANAATSVQSSGASGNDIRKSFFHGLATDTDWYLFCLIAALLCFALLATLLLPSQYIRIAASGQQRTRLPLHSDTGKCEAAG